MFFCIDTIIETETHLEILEDYKRLRRRMFEQSKDQRKKAFESV